MNSIELIRKKRDGEELNEQEINYLIKSYTAHKIPDYQFSAFLMAAFLKGLSPGETSFLTKAMLHSGKIINLNFVKGKKIDKHSTGGVGDKTSLILAPIAAAAGVYVPMISGRGLGHTGGTLDKLESIPGFKTNLSIKEYKSTLKKCGAVLIGQTKDIAPADRLMYALRDVTATVESIPLITGSIMSKKLAEGIDGLVLDIKTGSGAFMRKMEDAQSLAESLVNTAKAFGKEVVAFITDMNQPLGNYIGNWLEIYESIKVLKGENEGDLFELSCTLSGAMIYLGKKAATLDDGIRLSKELIKNGKAFEKFIEIVKSQNGNTKFIERPEKYPKAKFIKTVVSGEAGFLTGIDTFSIGMAAVELGAGRKTMEDKIDPKAGIIFYPKIGDKIQKGKPIAQLHSDSKKKINFAEEKISNAIRISDQKIKQQQLVKKIIK